MQQNSLLHCVAFGMALISTVLHSVVFGRVGERTLLMVRVKEFYFLKIVTRPSRCISFKNIAAKKNKLHFLTINDLNRTVQS